MEKLEEEGIRKMLANRIKWLKEWVKPNPADSRLIQGLKLIYKSIAVLILIALSPVILVALLFVFFAAL
jgi:hypothetical protein